MITQTQIESVRKYLQGEFPDYKINDYDDPDYLSIKFTLMNNSKLYVVKFERRFLDDNSDLKGALQNLELSEFMKSNDGKQVFVGSKGLSLL